MSLLTAWNSWRRLDARQRALIKEKEIDASMSLEEWIPFLGGIARFDRAGDGLRKALGWLTLISVPLGLIPAIVTDSPAPLLVWLLSLGLGISWWRLRKIDIPSSLDRFLLPWLTLLKEDIQPKSEVVLRLDLRGAEMDNKSLMASDMPRGLPKSPRNCQDTYFRDDWLSGTASLADGAVLRWQISDLVRQRIKTRSNSRGKTKRKTKYKIQRSFDVQLSVRARDYQVAQLRPDTACRESVKHGEKRAAIRVRTRSIGHELTTPPRLDELVGTVSRAYRHLSIAPKER
ncbi:hypothetical protein VVD49_10660 [Uliginosibacterium sp. H3]|uniref:Uncharacterized protein n=1 Tax=Uliginosibacterium silvisoli TaxID=3114758 RepID=A0ABU6K3L5_9RHOO|nr:hypothetical protein [Uliginosibacterium sp. H3]